MHSALAEANPGKDLPSGGEHVVDAVVVGAGWSGLWTLHLLLEQGRRVILVDAHAAVGGVWHHTKYPGCRVDTEVGNYAFDEPRLRAGWAWSERYPHAEEIQRYLEWTCSQLQLGPYIKLNTRVDAARWKEQDRRWSMTGTNNFRARATFFIPCCGYSEVPYIPQLPQLPGRDDFSHMYHSSRWPAKLDLTNKRVGVVGTGATGLQIIEAIAPIVAHLVVFQRTPNLAIPAGNDAVESCPQSNLSGPLPSSTFTHTRDERDRTYQQLWEQGGGAFWLRNYPDMLTLRKANDEAYKFWLSKVRPRIRDPSLAEILAPDKPPHAFGVKRPTLERGYFEVFNQRNVVLVDLTRDPIESVHAGAVDTVEATHLLDELILATGFDAVTGSLLAVEVKGSQGVPLSTKWDVSPAGDGVRTSLGLASQGFPNMFFPMGPQAPTSSGQTPRLAQIQGTWVSRCIQWMADHGHDRVEASEAGEQAWWHRLSSIPGIELYEESNSWYVGGNLPRRKTQPMCDLRGILDYEIQLTASEQQKYPEFVFSPARTENADGCD